MMLQYLNYYLPVFLVAYLVITFILPSIRVYNKTGINPVTFGKSDNAHDYIGAIMKMLTALLGMSVLLFSISDSAYKYLNPISFLQVNWLQYTGLIVVHASLVWIVFAQSHMNQSWRIGIDEKNSTELITGGLFSFSRNPIFLGMLFSTIGIFLIITNTVTFFVAAATYIVIQIHIRLEEEFLFMKHGVIYAEYKRNIRRLI